MVWMQQRTQLSQTHVTQGSTQGPLLLNIFLNDIASGLSAPPASLQMPLSAWNLGVPLGSPESSSHGTWKGEIPIPPARCCCCSSLP